MDPPRTLLISPYLDAQLPSGGVLYSLDVLREWLREGRHVAVLCSEGKRSLGDLEEYARTGRLTLHPIVTPEQIRFTHHLHSEVAFLAEQAVRLFRPDIIHVHNTQGMLAAVLASVESTVPVVLTALDFGLVCFSFYLHGGTSICRTPGEDESCRACISGGLHGIPGRLGPYLPRAITRRLWPRFVRLDTMKLQTELRAVMSTILGSLELIVAPSPIMAEIMRAGAGPTVRVEELLYGVSPAKILRPPKTRSDKLRLAYLGSAEPIKGLGVLIEASARLPDGLALEIRAIGGEPVREAIDQAPERARRYLRHQPALFGPRFAREHAEIDAVLVPSLWHENSPFVILESLANGTPVIASDTAGIRHLVQPDRSGWLIEAGSAQAWSERILAAAREPLLVREMSEHAQFIRTTADFVTDLRRCEQELLRDAATSCRAVEDE